MAYSDQLSDNYDNYGYTPSIAMSGVFLAIFAISTILHTYQSFTRKSPRFMVLMSIAGGVELIGWAGRVWSRYDWYGSGYVLLGVVISVVAQDKSFLSSKLFKILFITADIFSLVLQGAGGGIAATANTNSAGDAGSNLMLAGIVIQLVVMIVFVGYGLLWARRAQYELRTASSKLRLLLFGMLFSSIMIIIRGVYRTCELAGGFSGSLAQNQNMFLLDAIPISMATLALNVWHPNRLLVGSLRSGSGSQASFVDMTNAPGEKKQQTV
ncbi:hypothetical protein RQP46_005850 [Phenoliferia psychrophenolica]